MKKRFFKRLGIGFAVLTVSLLVVIFASTEGFRTFGGAPSPGRWEVAKASPHFKDGKFKNLEETNLMSPLKSGPVTYDYFFGAQMRVPSCALPLVSDGWKALQEKPASGLRISWLGHSTSVIEIDGATFLTDPIFSVRASPVQWAGPKRYHPPPWTLDQLPKIDAVLISHEHYDHLDMATVQALAKKGVAFFVPLGIGAHLDAWDVPPAQIREVDWNDLVTLPGGVTVVATPARHFNGRGFPGRPGSSWTSWTILGPQHRVFFSGDTGPTPQFKDIGQRFGPFDVAMLEIGQHHPAWGDIHLGPLGAVDAAQALNARRLFPIHWSTFVLALHHWNEPPETMRNEAEKRGLPVVTPKLGEPVEPTAVEKTDAWWRAYPPIAAKCP